MRLFKLNKVYHFTHVRLLLSYEWTVQLTRLLRSSKIFKILGTSGLLIFLTFFSGCNNLLRNQNFNSTGGSSSGVVFEGTASGNPGGGVISFNLVFNTVLKNNCLSCHNQNDAAGGIRYDDYNSTLQHGGLSSLQRSYLKYVEPSSKCKSISRADMDLVRTWIEFGTSN